MGSRGRIGSTGAIAEAVPPRPPRRFSRRVRRGAPRHTAPSLGAGRSVPQQQRRQQGSSPARLPSPAKGDRPGLAAGFAEPRGPLPDASLPGLTAASSRPSLPAFIRRKRRPGADGRQFPAESRLRLAARLRLPPRRSAPASCSSSSRRSTCSAKLRVSCRPRLVKLAGCAAFAPGPSRSQAPRAVGVAKEWSATLSRTSSSVACPSRRHRRRANRRPRRISLSSSSPAPVAAATGEDDVRFGVRGLPHCLALPGGAGHGDALDHQVDGLFCLAELGAARRPLATLVMLRSAPPWADPAPGRGLCFALDA